MASYKERCIPSAYDIAQMKEIRKAGYIPACSIDDKQVIPILPEEVAAEPIPLSPKLKEDSRCGAFRPMAKDEYPIVDPSHINVVQGNVAIIPVKLYCPRKVDPEDAVVIPTVPAFTPEQTLYNTSLSTPSQMGRPVQPEREASEVTLSKTAQRMFERAAKRLPILDKDAGLEVLDYLSSAAIKNPAFLRRVRLNETLFLAGDSRHQIIGAEELAKLAQQVKG